MLLALLYYFVSARGTTLALQPTPVFLPRDLLREADALLMFYTDQVAYYFATPVLLRYGQEVLDWALTVKIEESGRLSKGCCTCVGCYLFHHID